jgi:serine/threonine protein phosphatase 1
MEYAIGDIHGCIRSFRLLLDQIQPGATDTVILLGYYLDRGPDSCAVLETILALSRHPTVIPLQGNHEIMLRDAHVDRAHHDEWIDRGSHKRSVPFHASAIGDSFPCVLCVPWANRAK